MSLHDCETCSHSQECEDKDRFMGAKDALKEGGIVALVRWTVAQDPDAPSDTWMDRRFVLFHRIEAGLNAFSVTRNMAEVREYCSVIQAIGDTASAEVGKEFRKMFSDLHLHLSSEYMTSTLGFIRALGEAMGSEAVVVSPEEILPLSEEPKPPAKGRSDHLTGSTGKVLH